MVLIPALLFLSAPLGAQESLSDLEVSRTPSKSPIPWTFPVDRIPQGTVDVDGRLEEEVWSQIQPLSGFVQGDPVEGIPAEYDTEVRVAFAEDAIYVAARMWDTEPGSIGTQLVRRDGEGAFDWFSFAIDTNLDQRTGYHFRVSAAGVQKDEYLFDDNRTDVAWDAIWESAVQIDDRGWTVEFRVPLSQIRYQASPDPQAWGINFARRRLANSETSFYALISRTQQGKVSQFARMEDVRVTKAVRRIEARPYVLSSLHDGPSSAEDPFFDGREMSSRFGTDLRFGLGSAFSLDATLNPDFGQVEADPAVINLSAFETFFEERRPFFVEDANLLNFGLSGHRNGLFYSRRIGRSPQGSAPSGAAFTDVPDAATILGAAKITGRTAGGLSVGGLAAVTQREMGRAFLPEDGTLTDYVAEPRTRYGVLRLQQDFNGGASQFGGILTTATRSLPNDGSFDFLPSSSFSAGLNFEHQWDDRTWALTGFLAASHVRGDSTALIRIQRSSNHYFQRPDALYESVDSSATSISGIDWRLQLDKRRGEHWTWGIWAAQVTGGFEINDLGFSQRREVLDGGLRVTYQEIQPGTLFRNYNISFFTYHNWSHEALNDAWSWEAWKTAHTGGGFNLNTRVGFLNYWGANLDLNYGPNNYSRTATRGGPVMIDPGSWRANLRMNSDRRKAVSFSTNLSYRENHGGSGHDLSLGAGVELRPSPRLEISVSPSWQVQRDAAQYVTSTSVVPYEPTYGRRYLFAELERTSLSMVTRLDFTVSPALSLQLYAQPLLSSGDYVRYRQLAAASSYAFREFEVGMVGADGSGGVLCRSGDICRTPDDKWHVDFDGDQSADFTFRDRDFNFRSLIGNAVLRWEYRPGSTLFLVWQRRQSAYASVGDFDFNRDLDALWQIPSDNVFIVKVNYWLGL
ncbi:MAG: carbohydrate binding family 9 domain-containing protein [Gemmatimonadales bacterium]|nr:MAG: carbohydrate binding family 9 domain-containing protein [Gemmatimonadales bacterium]